MARVEHITLITTGGTIDKGYPTGVNAREYFIGEPFAPAFVRRMLGSSVEVRHVPLMRKDSLDLTDDDRAAIVATCAGAEAYRVVITHGTDKMLKTAAALESRLSGRKRLVILTGAFQPAANKESDAEFNLGLALGACLALTSGIYIAMNGVYPWDGCFKDQTTGRFSATEAVEWPPLVVPR